MAPESRKTGAKPAAQGASRAWEALTPALSEWILEAVSSMGFNRMTPVQASTIPLFMGNKDVVVEAVTGSGKTLAFIVPLVEKLLRLEEPIKKHHIGGIILSPTRELAIQIHSVLVNLLAFHAPSAAALRPPDTTDDISMSDITASQPPAASSSKALKILPQLLLGGSSTTPQQDLSQFLIHSPNLLIATPGRLLELLSSPHVHCPQSSFEVLILDEADRLLDMGFKEDLTRILQRLPKQRRTGLFSASMTEGVDQLVRVGLRNPVRIAVKVRGVSGIEGTATEELRVPASLQLTYLATAAHHKIPALIHLLGSLSPQPHRSILYLSTCAAVDYFSHVLPLLLKTINTSSTTQPYSLIPLHGKQLPNHRTRNFTAFVSSPTPAILLTTDLAARGLDIPQVDLTVQLDPPSDPATFMHRAGRAGRAGRKGLGVVFLLEGREADEYPSFLAVRKTPVRNLLSIAPFSTTPELSTGFSPEALATIAENVTVKLRKQVRADRTLHDKAQRAFVSFVRSYSAHAASSIFRVHELNWSEHALAWGLLRMPKMPELAKSNWDWKPNQNLGLDTNWDTYAYKDKAKEDKRKAEVAAKAAERELGKDGAGAMEMEAKRAKRRKLKAWSEKTEAHDLAGARRERKARKRDGERRARLTESERAEEEATRMMVEEVRRRGVVDDGEFEGFD